MGSVTTETAVHRRYSVGWRPADHERRLSGALATIHKQSYAELKAECLRTGKLFEDPEFPAESSSVYYSEEQDFEWKRPTEICDQPHMFVGGFSEFDVCQGDLGNCWFLAAVASLCAARDKTLFHRVVPADNSFNRDYAGIFHFHFWQSGRWVDVVIDDRLPTVDGRLDFMHSTSPNEFWSALLEKAYAKLYGSYEALQGGNSGEAMVDFTGGVCEMFDFRQNKPADLKAIMMKALQRSSLMGCTIDSDSAETLPNGLVPLHAFTITKVKNITFKGKETTLVCIRNPWGNQTEWTGPWGDKSTEWKEISENEKEQIGLVLDEDGEFWMSFEDFTQNFNKLEICYLSVLSLQDEAVSSKRRWEARSEDGYWKTRVNAGGCRNFLDTFWTNPQYRVEVVDPDEDDDDNMGTLICALMQKERRKKRSEGATAHTIGYMLYELPDKNCGPLDMQFFKYNQSKGKSTFSNTREVLGRHRLLPGHYCIIPCTHKPNQDADFLLRIYSEKPAFTAELDENTGIIAQTIVLLSFTLPGATALKRRQKAERVTLTDVIEEKEMREFFKKTAGEDLEVDAYELKDIVNQHFKHEMRKDLLLGEAFSLETSRSMVAMMDVDKSGKLGYEEFKKLWTDIRKWKKIFQEFDVDKSGSFNSYELRQALNSSGYSLSNSTFNSLVMRYSDQKGLIYFDDFVLCTVRLKTMFDLFLEMTHGMEEREASFQLDEFIQTTMYS